MVLTVMAMVTATVMATMVTAMVTPTAMAKWKTSMATRCANALDWGTRNIKSDK